MPTVNIEGRKVRVDDGFLKLSPDEQAATVDEIAKSLGIKPEVTPAAVAKPSLLANAAAAIPAVVDDPMGGAPPADRPQPVRAEMPYPEQMGKIGQLVDNGVRLAANGATFGLADKLAGGMDYITGKAGSYDEGVKAQRAETDALKKAAPVPAAIAEGAGGLASGAGLVKSGITLAGRVGPSLVKRILAYGAEGGLYGAAHGAGNTFSGNLSDYLDHAFKGAQTGALLGGALPIVGAGAGAVYRGGSAFLGPRVAGTGRGASALMRTAAQADEAGLRTLPKMGDAAMLVDSGPSLLGLGQGAGTGTGTGKTMLVNALKERDANTGQRLAGAVEGAVGPSPVPSHIERDLHVGRNITAEAYGPAMEMQPRVDNRVLARELDVMIDRTRGPAQRSLRQVREMLDITNSNVLDRDPHTLLAARHAVDGMITAEAANPQVVGQLTAARQLIDQRLARAAPEVKRIDARYEELSRQSDALKRGSQVFDGGKEAIRPVELAEEIERTALPGGLQVGPPAARGTESAFIGPSAAPHRLRQGARAEIDRVVGTSVNDLHALEKTLGTPQDWNSQKLATVFGEDARDQIARAITHNRQFRESYQRIAQNSATAQRTEAAASMKGAEGGNVPHDLTLTGLGAKGVNLIFKALSGAANSNTRNQIGEVLSQRGDAVHELARELLSSARRSGDNARSISGLLGNSRWVGAGAPAYDRR